MLEDMNVISVPPQNRNLSVDSLNNKLYNFSNLQNTWHEGNSSDSPSPSDTLNSASSFAYENDSSSMRMKGKNTGTLQKSSAIILSYYTFKNDSMKINSDNINIAKDDDAKNLSCENKVVQTDTHQEIFTISSSVKELTERIKKLAISLGSVSQQKEPCNYNGESSNEPHNFHTEGMHNLAPHNNIRNADEPSCLKQSPSCDLKQQDTLNSHKSNAEKNTSFQNVDCYYNCQCCHNRCHMHCCSSSCNFRPCCSQPVPGCNRQLSMYNNLENFTSPTIVIPVQHISNNALLQILSVLKSESAN